MKWVVLAIAILLVGCDSGSDTEADPIREAQDRFVQAAMTSPSGYSRTGPLGESLSTDPDDWRTAPLFESSFGFVGAYPNPVAIGSEVVLAFNVGVDSFKRLVVRGSDDRTLGSTVVDGAAGAYAIKIDSTILGKGLWRLFLYNENNDLVTYGDLLVE